MTAANPLYERLMQEIRQIPDEKLSELLDVIHYFRLGVQYSKNQDAKTPQEKELSQTLTLATLAGSWQGDELVREPQGDFDKRIGLD